jgi:putative CocE/NonD family hydrolase
MHKRWQVFCLSILAILAARGIDFGQQGRVEKKHDRPEPKFQVRLETSVLVPMRDGIKLSTDLYFPEGVQEKLPVILIRTPYNKNADDAVVLAARMFASQGYVAALQDTRGRYESEGEYTVSAADTNDGSDAVDWLASQPWSTGKVGTYGCSYRGENQVEMAKLCNPRHAAMIPQASGGARRYFGTITGGAIELASGSEWFRTNGAKIRPTLGPTRDATGFAEAAHYFNLDPQLPPVDWVGLWQKLPIIDMVKVSGAPPSDWEDFVSHDLNNPWWDHFGYVNDAHRFNTPALFVDSWYDYGPADTLALFNLFQKNGESDIARQNVFAIIAPTTHCVYARDCEQTTVGQRFIGDARLDFYGIYLRWFDYWLKGIDNGVTRMPKLQVFVMGRNRWRAENEWPLARTRFTKYYLHSDGRANSRNGTGTISTTPPGSEPSDRYVYDPASPVPTIGGPDFGTPLPGHTAGAANQSPIEVRDDVLVYTTPPLEQGLEVTGPIQAVLYVSSTAKDTDFTTKLVDVASDGTAYNVQEGILRARYREGFDKKVWMRPGEVYEVRVDLSATSNYFAPGHRIRIQVSSSNFPRFDRNLNTGGNNYDETEWAVAKNAVYHSGMHASYIMLPVIPEK